MRVIPFDKFQLDQMAIAGGEILWRVELLVDSIVRCDYEFGRLDPDDHKCFENNLLWEDFTRALFVFPGLKEKYSSCDHEV